MTISAQANVVEDRKEGFRWTVLTAETAAELQDKLERTEEGAVAVATGTLTGYQRKGESVVGFMDRFIEALDTVKDFNNPV